MLAMHKMASLSVTIVDNTGRNATLVYLCHLLFSCSPSMVPERNSMPPLIRVSLSVQMQHSTGSLLVRSIQMLATRRWHSTSVRNRPSMPGPSIRGCLSVQTMGTRGLQPAIIFPSVSLSTASPLILFAINYGQQLHQESIVPITGAQHGELSIVDYLPTP